MPEWSGMGLARFVLLFSALLYLGIWVQLSLMHWSGGFKRRAMWGPVLATPVFAAAAAAAAFSRGGTLGWAFAAVLAVGVLEGLVGLTLHVRAISYQVGGYSLRNILSGPPPVLPLAYALIGVLALAALIWDV